MLERSLSSILVCRNGLRIHGIQGETNYGLQFSLHEIIFLDKIGKPDKHRSPQMPMTLV